MEFHGSESFAIPESRLGEYLADLRFLVDSVPQAEVQFISAEEVRWKMPSKLSMISSKLDCKLSWLNRGPSPRRYQLEVAAMMSSLTAEISLELNGESAGSRIDWQAIIRSRTGLLKMAPESLLEQLTRQMINEIWTGIRSKTEQS
jgi:carbon monoxide dehydrogenase subunit G